MTNATLPAVRDSRVLCAADGEDPPPAPPNLEALIAALQNTLKAQAVIVATIVRIEDSGHLPDDHVSITTRIVPIPHEPENERRTVKHLYTEDQITELFRPYRLFWGDDSPFTTREAAMIAELRARLAARAKAEKAHGLQDLQRALTPLDRTAIRLLLAIARHPATSVAEERRKFGLLTRLEPGWPIDQRAIKRALAIASRAGNS